MVPRWHVGCHRVYAVVCARECGIVEDRLTPIPLSLLPNSHRLVPRKTHPAHDLFEGCLLEPGGLDCDAEDPIVSVCEECLLDLKKDDHHPPKHSLANQLWIGRTPWALDVLTSPEQLLIALVYPRVYVFKLFPKRQQIVRDVSMARKKGRRVLENEWTQRLAIMVVVDNEVGEVGM